MLVVGTGAGLFGFEPGAGDAWQPSLEALPGEAVTAVAAEPGALLAAVKQRGVCASADGGHTWATVLEGVTAKCLEVGADHAIYVGADPAAIHRSRSGGDEFEELAAIRALPTYAHWTFPNPPHLGNIHDLALAAENPDLIYAAVEVGGVIASQDGGDTWVELREGLHPDVHSLARVPGDTADVLYAATGQGFFRSQDAGQSWEAACDGLDSVYLQPLAVHPARPGVLFLGATRGRPRYWRTRPEGAAATIYRSDDAGGSWRPVMGGLPTTLPGVVEVLTIDPADPDTVYAGTGDGKVLVTRSGGAAWTILAEGLPPIYALAATGE